MRDLLRTDWLAAQMLIKPVGEPPDVPRHRQPAVLATVMDLDLDCVSLGASGGLKPLGLFQRDQRVGVAMIDQGRRQVGLDVVDGDVSRPMTFQTARFVDCGPNALTKLLGGPPSWRFSVELPRFNKSVTG